MAAVKDLFLDLGGAGASVDNRPRLVRGILYASTYVLPLPYHFDKLQIALRALQRNPDATQTAPYTYLNLSSAAVTLKIWDSVGVIVLASQTVWSIDGTGNILSAELDLFTAAMITAMTPIAIKSTLSTILELVITFGDGTYTYRDDDFRIGKSLNISGTGLAVPAGRLLTWDEANALFVKFFGNAAGKTVTLVSLDTNSEVVLGVRDDGTFQADVT